MRTTDEGRGSGVQEPAIPRTKGGTPVVKDMKPFIYDVSLPEMSDWVARHDHAPYRVRQIFSWLWRGIHHPDDMTNLPESLRRQLEADYDFDGLHLIERIASKEDATCKYISRLGDGNVIETVFMKYRRGTSVCITTQAGCRMGCRFCASPAEGFGRNLTAGEMLAQVALVGKDRGERIDHVVLMGIGEPLDNYVHVVRFIERVNDPKAFNIGMRKITLSTCGLVPQIYRFMDEQMPITLAVSLHAPNDTIRQALMPIAKRYPMDMLLDACRTYAETTGRRITYEYCLMHDVNDRPEHAEELADRLAGTLCHVNLIPMNPVEESRYRRSTPECTERFREILDARHIPVTVRRELGTDIAAACGQLRRRLT